MINRAADDCKLGTVITPKSGFYYILIKRINQINVSKLTVQDKILSPNKTQKKKAKYGEEPSSACSQKFFFF